MTHGMNSGKPSMTYIPASSKLRSKKRLSRESELVITMKLVFSSCLLLQNSNQHIKKQGALLKDVLEWKLCRRDM